MIEVYCHTAPNGKKYVGLSAAGAKVRWHAHVSAARAGSPQRFHCAIRKHGPESFTHEVLERVATEAGAKRAEQLWIKELGTFGGGGYNATAGGEGVPGLRHRPESLARMSASQKLRSPEGFAAQAAKIRGRRGYKHTPEARARMREACKGRYFPENLAKAFTPDAIEKRAAKIRGVRLSAEHCAKLSVAHTGRTQSAETIEKRAAALRGRKRPPEVRAKISATKRKNRAL